VAPLSRPGLTLWFRTGGWRSSDHRPPWTRLGFPSLWFGHRGDPEAPRSPRRASRRQGPLAFLFQGATQCFDRSVALLPQRRDDRIALGTGTQCRPGNARRVE
jgi:hypothetical protein